MLTRKKGLMLHTAGFSVQYVFFTLDEGTGLDIGARLLAQASVKNCQASTYHGSLA